MLSIAEMGPVLSDNIISGVFSYSSVEVAYYTIRS